MAQSLHVCVLYNAPVSAADDPDFASEAGVLESVAALGESLRAAGHNVTEFPAGESVALLARQLDDLRPDVVVNLCESFGGNSAGEAHIAALLETLGLAYTGATPECLALTRNKAQTKRLLAGAGVPTASFVEVPPNQSPPDSLRGWLEQGPLVVKPSCEDASLGIGQDSVVRDWPALSRQAASVQRRYGSALAERYIAGREFNVGIIELPEVHVLPLAEIEYRGSDAGKWPILTYAGKWDSGSNDDQNTPVRCPANAEPALMRQIIAAATAAYRLMGCRDYARVDLRLDARGNIFVLEVNANPDLGSQAGLARMLAADGIEYSRFAEQLVFAAEGRIAEGRRQKAENRTDNPQANVRMIEKDDRAVLVELTRACGNFRPEEIAVADELIGEAEREGPAGHYQLLVAEEAGKIVGWACYGRVPMTEATFDLYWIVVAPDAQRRGVGRQLLYEVEGRARKAEGYWLLAETSSTAAYDSTREFYRRCGYRVVSEIGDFYRPADGKITYGKRLDRP